MDDKLAIESFRFENEGETPYFEMIVKCHKIPSVNSQYGIGRHGQVYRSPELVKFEQELKDQIVIVDPKKNCPWIQPMEIYDVHFVFIMNKSFWKRDVSNCVKSTEDIIFRCLGVDDSRVLTHDDRKQFMKGDLEKIIFRINRSHFEWDYFNK